MQPAMSRPPQAFLRSESLEMEAGKLPRRFKLPNQIAKRSVSHRQNLAWLAARLFRRTGIGVRLDVASLFIHDAAQLALHRFERIVDHFVERLMRAVVRLPFISNDLVATRHSHIDAAPVRISFMMRVIGLLDGHVAAVDVIAKFFQSRCIFQNEIVDLVGFFQTPVRYFKRQLHS